MLRQSPPNIKVQHRDAKRRQGGFPLGAGVSADLFGVAAERLRLQAEQQRLQQTQADAMEIDASDLPSEARTQNGYGSGGC